MGFKRKNAVGLFSTEDLMFGDKVNSTTLDADWYDAPTHIIRAYQWLHRYKDWRTTHVVTFVGTAHGRFNSPHVFEWTFPTARYTPFDEWYRPEEKIYTVHRYADAIPTLTAEVEYLRFFNRMDGEIYDVPSLFNFIVLDILGYDKTDWHPILDLGSKNMVCSVGARAADMLWFQKFLIYTVARRPGGELHVERTPPALFPEHDTYLNLGRLDRMTIKPVSGL